MKLKILSLIPLYQNGGASRLLRRLYAGRESQIITLAVRERAFIPKKGLIPEIDLPLFPVHAKWMRWKFRDLSSYLRKNVFLNFNSTKIRKAIMNIDFDVIHVINHGTFSNAFYDENFYKNKKIWVSFHDHYRLSSSYSDANFLWNIADRRLVISKELGEEYVKAFGDKTFEIVTDGVGSDELSMPKIHEENKQITIYFAGLLHLQYYILFEVLADALDIVCEKQKIFKIILRGTQELNFLSNRNFDVEYRKDFVSDEEIKLELDKASILYLPIKFSTPDFYLYSLSTKLISYLGSSGTILYHGPCDAAAHNLLKDNNAAISCLTLEVNDMIIQLKKMMDINQDISGSAKKLASTSFDLTNIRERFWNVNSL
jgi:glycosyltransferase involved in cell wall biosynthesis